MCDNIGKSLINIYYIRAAIEAATGVRLSLNETRDILLEEGLITKRQYNEEAAPLAGYDELYQTDVAMRDISDLDTEEGLPDHFIPGT